MMSEIIKAKKLKDRSWDWRQIAVNGIYRKKSFKTFLMAPLFKILYRRKNTWSHVTQNLIVGQNPWLNLLLAWRLSFKYNEIMIWNAPGLDWWNYSILQTETFLIACKKWFPYLDIESLENLIEWLKTETSKRANVIVLDNNFKPYQTYADPVTGCWIFKLVPGRWESMATEGLEMSESRRAIKERLEARFDNSIRATWPRVCATNNDDDCACHYLLAKKVYWTSRPPEGTEYEFKDTGDYKVFEKEAEFLIGCASKIAQNPEAFYSQVFEDTEFVIKDASLN